MKLWLLTQSVNVGYDTYDSCVVAANSEYDAKHIHPDKGVNWDGYESSQGEWASAIFVDAVLIGEAILGTEAGVICASFNAG
jgi:hypothetical protein